MTHPTTGGVKATERPGKNVSARRWRLRSTTWIGVVATLIATATATAAQSDDERRDSRGREPKREFRSSNERFELKVEPARAGRSRSSGCKASLREIRPGGTDGHEDREGSRADERTGHNEAPEDEGRDGDGNRDRDREDGREERGRSRWSRTLVNDIAPVEAAIRDDGRFVVTLGEHPGTGPRNALVIYGRRGELLRHFLLTDMLEEGDWEQARGDSGKLRWLEDAEWEFTREPEHFVLRLDWGREVRVDLNTLQLVDGEGDGRGRGTRGFDAAPDDVQAALRSGGRGEIEGGLALGGDDGDVEWMNGGSTVPDGFEDANIRELVGELLAADPHGDESATIRELLEQAGAKVVISDELNAEAREEIGRVLEAARQAQARGDLENSDQSAEIMLAGPEGAEPFTMPANGAMELVPFDGGNGVRFDPQSGLLTLTAPDGTQSTLKVAGSVMLTEDGDLIVQQQAEQQLMPPAPDPAAPVDYMTWLKDQTQTEGEDGAPLFQMAVDTFIPFPGDEALRDAALKGDPAALQSPEIGAWLAANRDSLEAARAGTKLDYRGPDLVSPSGDMIGILLPNLAPTRDIARAMSIEGRRAAANGDVDGAIQNFMDINALGASTGHGPTMIENLVGVAIQSQAQTGLFDLMEQQQDGSIDYAALAKRLESESRAPRPLSETVTMEQAMYMDMTQRVFSPGANPGEYAVNQEGVEYLKQIHALTDGLPNPDVATMAAELGQQGFQRTVETGQKFYTGMAHAADLPYPEAQAAFNQMSAEIEAESNPLVRSLMPSLQRSHQIRTRLEADRRGTQLVANLMAYKQAHGDFPESLDVFAGRDFANDPFTNQPFRYGRSASGFNLYSNGMNGTDDGGVAGRDGGRGGDHVIWPRVRE